VIKHFAIWVCVGALQLDEVTMIQLAEDVKLILEWLNLFLISFKRVPLLHAFPSKMSVTEKTEHAMNKTKTVGSKRAQALIEFVSVGKKSVWVRRCAVLGDRK
jgi:hypothetical protein